MDSHFPSFDLLYLFFSFSLALSIYLPLYFFPPPLYFPITLKSAVSLFIFSISPYLRTGEKSKDDFGLPHFSPLIHILHSIMTTLICKLMYVCSSCGHSYQNIISNCSAGGVHRGCEGNAPSEAGFFN